MQKKIFAVVVTYKRADILYNCLHSVLTLSTVKVDQLHIVVNSNDSETLEVINEFSISKSKITYEVFNNIGPAGGFHYGLKKFLSSDCDYVWLMDDDIIPKIDSLEALIVCSRNHSFVFPKVLKPSGKEVISFGWWGVFISKEIVEQVGLPMKDFFYWIEDTEYLQNRMMRRHKIFPFRCEEAIVTHLHNRSEVRPPWYYYYTIRNTLYYRLRIFPLNFRGIFILLKMTFKLIYRLLLKEPNKLKMINNFFLGVFHALQGKLGKIEHLHQGE